MSKFNGHKNWNHWNVSLWLNNDEGLYRQALWALKDCDNSPKRATDYLLQWLGDRTPDGAPYTKSSVSAVLREMKAGMK